MAEDKRWADMTVEEKLEYLKRRNDQLAELLEEAKSDIAIVDASIPPA